MNIPHDGWLAQPLITVPQDPGVPVTGVPGPEQVDLSSGSLLVGIFVGVTLAKYLLK